MAKRVKFLDECPATDPAWFLIRVVEVLYGRLVRGEVEQARLVVADAEMVLAEIKAQL